MTCQETRRLVSGDSWIIWDVNVLLQVQWLLRSICFNLQSWTKSWDLFCISGVFSNSPISSPNPTTTLDACIQNFFESKFQLYIGWGEGELQEKF